MRPTHNRESRRQSYESSTPGFPNGTRKSNRYCAPITLLVIAIAALGLLTFITGRGHASALRSRSPASVVNIFAAPVSTAAAVPVATIGQAKLILPLAPNVVLLSWNTFGNTGTETTEPSAANDPNLSGANLTFGAGLTAAANANRFGGSGWFDTGNTVAGNTLSEAIAGNNYIQFIVTPSPGFSVTPTSFVFSWDHSATGPASVTLRSSADSFATDLGSVTGMPVGITTGNTINISGLTNLTTATTFRLYGYAATATGGTGGFDTASSVVNVQLSGSTAAVGGTPTKLAITNISPASPTAGSGFSVTVQSQDGSNVPQNVTASTGFSLTTNGNAGTIGGTTSGTISPATNSVVVTGVTLSSPGTGATITATRTSGDALSAGTSASFNVTTATYSWVGGSGDWQVAANWSPVRTTPAVTDTLQFDSGGTLAVTNVPAQTIGQLKVLNTTLLTLQTAAANSLTIAGAATDPDLSVASGSQLNVSGASALTISLSAGALGTVAGSMTLNGAAHRLLANDASGITFQTGSTFTAGPTFTGNSFGTTSLNSIVFANGSTYVSQGGSDPFGASQPNSVVVFQPGSLFSFQQNTAPSLSGRTYANLEINAATFSQTSAGANAFIVDNLTVASGVAHLQLTNITIKGNIFVGAGQILDFNPTAAASIALSGTNGQMISGTGTLTFNSNANLTVNNANGISLSRDLTLNGALTLTNGIITTGANTLTLGSAATVSSGSASSYVSGILKKTAVTAAFTFPMGVNAVAGHAAGYTPLALANAIGGGDLTVTTNHAVQTALDTSKSLNEYWTLARAGTLTADLSFHYLDTDVNGNEADYQVVVVESGNATHFPVDVEHSVDTATNVFTVTGVSSFSDWTIAEPAAPTAVKLTSFRAFKNNGEVMLQWQSGYEARNLGYQIYREQDGKRVAITPSLVAGSALVAGRQTKLGAGSNYTWYDETTADGAPATAVNVRQSAVMYWLEDIDLNGTRTLHGPIVPEVSYQKPRGRELRAELMSEVSRRSAPNAVQIDGWPSVTAHSEKGTNDAAMFADPSDIQHDLAGMAGVKLAVSSAGWYRVSQAELSAAGFTVQDTRQLQLYRNGREVAISLSNGGNSFTTTDYLEFYGEGLDSPTTAVQTYYLVNGRGSGARISSATGNPNPAGPSGPQSFDYTVERKERMIYFSGLRNGDGENFFGQIVSSDPVSATMPASNLAGSPAQLEVVLQGVTNESHLVEIVFNGTHLGTLNFANTDHPAANFLVPAAALHEGDNTIELTSMGGASDVSLIDALRLTYNRKLVATDNMLSFSVNSRDTRRISGFTNPNIRVLDISDASAPFELKASVSPDAGGYAALVDAKQASALNPRRLLAIAGGQARQVDGLRANVPSALWTQKAGADYVLITTAELLPAFEPLAQLRRNQGMIVALVDVEDVYDEFSFGKHSPQALRDFLQRAVKSWKRQPHFVLFAGDASYDPKNYLGQGFNDLVPTKLVDTALTETASDDWLADFNRDGIADLAIGRLPVRTFAEAVQLVTKIVSYENSAVDPSRGALLVADTRFEATNNAMKNVMPNGQPVQLINRSATDDLTAHSQVIAGLNQGPRLANYFGHGSNGIWSGAGLLSSTDAPSLTNTNRLSVFTMMTCFNGYFHDAYNESLSEALLKSQAGAVAVWASTGLTEPSGQNAIGEEFYRLLFGTPEITLGEAARLAKSFTNDADVRRTWILFGDPATRLK